MAQTPIKPLEAKKYVIPRYAVDHLLESFQIVRTELSELLDIPDTNQADWSRYAEQWWNKQSDEDQFILRKIITAMGSPVLVTNLSVMHGNEGLINSRAVFTSTRLEDPAFMIGVDEKGENYNVSYVDSGNEILATLIVYLDAAADFGVTEFGVTLTLKELITYMGLMDLYRRNYYIAMLEHSREDFRISYDDIWKSVQDGMQYPDLRWALPFVLPSLIHLTQPPTQDEVNTAVQSLTRKGILQWKQEDEAFTLTDPGLFSAMTLLKVYNKVNLVSLGFDENGKRASKGAVFIRTDPILWTILLDGQQARYSSIELDPAVDIVKEILTPTMVPAKKSAAKAPVPKAAGDVPLCPKCGKPATWIDAYKRWYCYSCQEYLPQ